MIKNENEQDVDDMDMDNELKGSNVYFGFKKQLKRYREIVKIISEYLGDKVKSKDFKGDKGKKGEEGGNGNC